MEKPEGALPFRETIWPENGSLQVVPMIPAQTAITALETPRFLPTTVSETRIPLTGLTELLLILMLVRLPT